MSFFGVFYQNNKKESPYLTSMIGIITSPTVSVIHDIIKRIKIRFILYSDLWPVSVQGSDAVESIILAIKGFNDLEFLQKPDVIIKKILSSI